MFGFSGDYDSWVYFDKVLVLNVGGCRLKPNGSISSATGDVSDPTGYGTLYSRVEDAYAENDSVMRAFFNET